MITNNDFFIIIIIVVFFIIFFSSLSHILDQVYPQQAADATAELKFGVMVRSLYHMITAKGMKEGSFRLTNLASFESVCCQEN